MYNMSFSVVKMVAGKIHGGNVAYDEKIVESYGWGPQTPLHL